MRSSAYILTCVMGLIAASARAEDMTPAEAVGELMFATPYTAMKKSVVNGTVTWLGNDMVDDADRLVLSIAPGRADPCVFDAFFVEAFGPFDGRPAFMGAAYIATLDLRRPTEAAITPVTPPAGEVGGVIAKLKITGPSIACGRSVLFDTDLKMNAQQSCRDFIEDEIAESVKDRLPRLMKAFDVLRVACRW